MSKEALIVDFYKKYTSREETLSKMPLSMSVDEIWEAELAYRKERAQTLPLTDADGRNYWMVQTKSFTNAGDRLAELARNEAATSVKADSDRVDAATLIDEAYYSSVVEGAAMTLERARRFLESGDRYRTRDEQMLKGTLAALEYAASHISDSIDERMLLHLAGLLNPEANGGGYRTREMSIKNSAGEVVFEAAPVMSIGPMMSNLFRYVSNPRVHPIVKTAAAHAYFISVQPFADGNGRLARLLSYLILMDAGYDFFGRVPFSKLLADEKSRYYRALRNSLAPENGGDFTYFAEYYIGMLARSLEGVSDKLQHISRLAAVSAILDSQKDKRAIMGAKWLIESGTSTITTEGWRSHFDTSFETARQDLRKLEEIGFVNKVIVGRKHFYEIW